MQSYNLYGLNITPQERWGNGVSNFTIYDEARGANLDLHQWVAAAPGRTKQDFYKLQREAINKNAATIFEKAVKLDGGIGALDVDGLLRSAESLNSQAVTQVFNAHKSWETFSDLVTNRVSEGALYGLDIETFGDTFRGQDIFGITEIGISKRMYRDGVGTMDKDFGGAFVLGVNDQQRDYLQVLIKRFQKGEWDLLDESQQVSLRRLSRYAGQYHDVFVEKTSDMLGGGSYIMAQKLSRETISGEAFQSGLNNLVMAHRNQDTDEVLKKITTWLSQQDANGEIFYGANSQYDINGLVHTMQYANRHARQSIFSESEIAHIANMKDSTLDTAYIVRAVAAKGGQSVQSFLQEVTPRNEAVGATVEELVQAFDLAKTQTHMSAEDLENEGQVLDKIGELLFKKRLGENNTQLFTKTKGVSDLIVDRNFGDTAFYIQRGRLDQRNGSQFGVIKSYVADENGTRTIDKSLPITKQFWRVDTDLSGAYQDEEGTLYTMVFNNIADEITAPKGQRDSITQFVISSRDITDFREQLGGLISNSQLYDITIADRENPLNGNIPLSADSLIGQMAVKEQGFHIADNARREYHKLISAPDVRVDKGDAVYGFQGLKDYFALENAVRETENNWYMNYERVRFGDTKAELDKLLRIIDSDEFTGKKYSNKLLHSFNQQQTYLGMRPILESEEPLMKTLMGIVETKLPETKGVDKVALNMERTALLSEMYQASLDILYDGRVPYLHSPGVPLRADYYGIDFKYINQKTGKEAVQRFNAYSPDTFARDLSGFLRRNPNVGVQDVIHDFKTRGFLGDGFSVSKDVQPYFASQEIGAAIYHGMQEGGAIRDTLESDRLIPIEGPHGIVTTQTKRALGDSLHNFVNPETLEPMSMKEVLMGNTDLQRRITDTAQGIADNHRPIVFYHLNNGDHERILENKIKDVMPSLNIEGNEEVDKAASILKQLIYGDKSYSLANNYEKGVQAMLITPNIGNDVAAYQGSGGFMLLFNQKNAGKVVEMVSSGKYDDAFKSYADFMNSEIAEFAAPLELPRLHKYEVSDTESIFAFTQGSQEKIISKQLATYKLKDGRLGLKYDDPGSQLFGSLYKVMERAMEQVAAGDTEQAARTMRRAYNGVIKDSPSFASYRAEYTDSGILRTIHFNPNDAIHASELRLNQGLSEIFEEMAMMSPSGVRGNIHPDEFNPVQNVLMAFGKAQGLSVRDNKYGEYFQSILRSDDWKEFFQSRSVQGTMTGDMYLGDEMRNLVGTTNATYAKPLLEIMRDMIEDPKQAETLGKFFSMDENSASSLVSIFKAIPNASKLTALGSESAVHHGSYFTKPHAAYQSFSGLYSLMRPPYTQQGNSYSFDLKEAVEASKEFSKYTTTKGYSSISFGLNSIESSDYIFRQRIADAGKNLPNNAPRLKVDEHNFIVRAKVMGDLDAHLRFEEMSSGDMRATGTDRLTALLAEKGFTTVSDSEIQSLYDEALQDMRSQLGSLYEDKSWSSPALKAQPMFQERDAIKLELNPDAIDVDNTRKQLRSIVRQGGIIENDSVIGFRHDGSRIYYSGASVELKEDNIETFLTNGIVRLQPQGYGDIFDDKLLLNGFEKSTVHTIDTKLYARNLKLAERIAAFQPGSNYSPEQIEAIARDIGTMMFSQLSDGAMVVGNYDFAKHGGVVGLHNYWTALSTRYAEEAQRTGDPELLRKFAEISNEMLGQKGFFQIVNVDGYNRIAGSTYEIERPAEFLKKLAEFENNPNKAFSVSDTFWSGISDEYKQKILKVNARVAEELSDLKDTNSFLAIAQRQIMNEHMGKKFTIDQRVEQALRTSGLRRGPNGLVDVTSSDVDSRLVDLIKQHSFSYSGASRSRYGIADYAVTEAQNSNTPLMAYEKFQLLQNQFSVEANRDRARYNIENTDMRRTLTGMTESLHYYMHPEELDNLANKNIIEVGIDELADEIHRTGKPHATAEDLKDTIFFVDGEPSEFLKKLARRKGDVDPSVDSYSIFIDMGNHQFIANPRKLPGASNLDIGKSSRNGFMIPIVNARYSSAQGEYIYQDSQRSVTKVLNRVIDTITSGKTEVQQAGELGLIIEDFYESLNKNTHYLSKNSDMYKGLQTWVIPTSRNLLAQDEISPYYKDLFTMKWSYNDSGELEKNALDDLLGPNLYSKKRELERKIRDAGHAGETPDAKLLGQYQSVLDTIQSNFEAASRQIKEAAGDPAKWNELTTLNDISKELARAQREVIDIKDEAGNIVERKIYNGLAIAIGEEAFETQGIKMATIAQTLVSDYQQNEWRTAQGKSPIDPENFVEGFLEYIGEKNDYRVSLIEGEDVASELQKVRRKAMSDRVQEIQRRLEEEGVNIVDGDIISSVQEYITSDIPERIMAKTPEEFAISIRSLNRKTAAKVQKKLETVEDIFKQSGIAQDYLRDFGMQGIITRFPVFKGQPWIRAVLDPTLTGKGQQFRTLNPVLTLMVHLDHDGDTAMMALLGDGTGLLRARDEISQLHKQVYRRNAQEYIPGLLGEAIQDGKITKVNDPTAWIRQEASLMEIIDESAYKKGIEEFLKDFKASSSENAKFAKDITVDNIKSKASLLEAAMNSRHMSDVFDKTIKSTLTNDNAVIAGTVARIRKNYIGYVSTPNYRMRESINQAVRMLRTDEVANEEILNLLNYTLTGFTAMDVGSGGIFSAIEQKVIDPKWAKDSLTPIGVKRYSTGLNSLIANAGGESSNAKKAVNSAYMKILSAVGAKALDTNGSEQQHRLLADILTNSRYDQYQSMLRSLAEAKKTGRHTNITHLRMSTQDLMPLQKSLQQLESFKGLEQIVVELPQFKSIWDEIVNHGYYSNIENSQLFKGKSIEDLKVLRNAFDAIGFSDDVFTQMYIRSADLPPFEIGHVYTRSGSLTETEDVGRYVYRGDGKFDAIDRKGNVVKLSDGNKKRFVSRNRLDFDQRGFDSAPLLEDFKNNVKTSIVTNTETGASVDISTQRKIGLQMQSSKFENVLNNIVFDENTGALRTKIPNNFIPASRATKTFSPVKMASIVSRSDQWDATQASLQESMKTYGYAVANGYIKADAMERTGAELLRKLNTDTANQVYRDLAAMGEVPTEQALSMLYQQAGADGNGIAELLRAKVVSALPEGEKTYNEIAGIVKNLPDSFDVGRYNDALQSLQRNIYSVPQELNSLNKIFSDAQQDLEAFTRENAPQEVIDRYKDFIGSKSSRISAIKSHIDSANFNTVLGGQYSLYDMLTPKGFDDDAKRYMRTIFNWSTTEDADVSKSIVGFGTYIGQRFEDLNKSDVEAILAEARSTKLADAIEAQITLGKDPKFKEAFLFAREETRSRLEGFTPTANKSALTLLQNRRESDTLRDIRDYYGSIAQQSVNDAADAKLKDTASQVAASGMKKQTVTGGVLDKLSGLNITGKQVATVVGAMAALGMTNKLLHKRKKSPLESKSGSGAPPIVNGMAPQGKDRSERDIAPPSANIGGRVVYHDKASGLDFKVSARTKHRLDGQGYAGITHQAGGGPASVHIYNDTRGVSDNWLSNKFSELAE